MKDKILVIDIETTSVSPKTGCLVEVGVVELNIKTGRVRTLFDSLILEPQLNASHREYLDVVARGEEPTFKHKGWIFGNSDLTPEMVREAPAPEDVFPKVQAIIDKYPMGVTAFNRNFDVPFLESRGIKFGKLQPCPMLVLTDVIKLPHKNGRRGHKWPSCEEAWEFLFPKKKYVEQHRGADDAKHEAKIIFQSINEGYYKVE